MTALSVSKRILLGLTIGIEIYPLNVMEIKIQTRFNEINMSNSTIKKDPEYLIQTHFYF